MKSVVIYGSRYGNTRMVAEAIGRGLAEAGPAEVMAAADVDRIDVDVDCLVVGGPTEAHRMTPPVTAFLDRAGLVGLEGVLAAAFATRLPWPRWLSGSAAAGIDKRLVRLGATVIAPPEDFIVERKSEAAVEGGVELLPGEIERAERWGRSLASTVAHETAVATAPIS